MIAESGEKEVATAVTWRRNEMAATREMPRRRKMTRISQEINLEMKEADLGITQETKESVVAMTLEMTGTNLEMTERKLEMTETKLKTTERSLGTNLEMAEISLDMTGTNLEMTERSLGTKLAEISLDMTGTNLEMTERSLRTKLRMAEISLEMTGIKIGTKQEVIGQEIGMRVVRARIASEVMRKMGEIPIENGISSTAVISAISLALMLPRARDEKGRRSRDKSPGRSRR